MRMPEINRKLRALGAVSAAAALALAGCTTTVDPPDSDSAGSTASPTASESPSATPTEGGLPFLASSAISTDSQDGAGSASLLTDLRLGSHDGFDRVVLEYRGEGAPGWEVGYVDEAISDGIGEPVAVGGNAILQVRTMGVRYPEESDADAFRGDPGPIRVTAAGTVSVVEVVYDHVFEGYGMTFVGVESAAGFRVYRLTDPTRIVVEIAHPD